MKNEFKVGDRVRYIVDDDISVQRGETGTICCIDEISVGVEWDIELYGRHGCRDTCRYGHGWFVWRGDIEIVQPEPEPEQDYATLNVLELFA